MGRSDGLRLARPGRCAGGWQGTGRARMELTLIGIGAGDPEQLTLQAVAALQAADAVLIPRKGEDKAELAALRDAICAHHLAAGAAQLVHFDMPVRDPAVQDYRSRVNLWHDAIAGAWAQAMADLPDQARVALLVWGDPALYDSTLRIAARLQRLRPVELRVVPGLMSPQLLTAAHGIALNTLAEPFLVTTGRHLRESGWPADIDTLVVMLDGDCAFQSLPPEGIWIWWGAYVGMAGQILDQGPLAEAGPRIIATRAGARAARGWIMDIYLLRRLPQSGSPPSAP